MKTRSMYQVLALSAGLLAAALSTPAEAATTLARIVSRANCLVPLPKLSLIQANGYTFNESISWDPYVWPGHRELPNPYGRPMRFVSGDHWEILDGMTIPIARRSGATDCNITTW